MLTFHCATFLTDSRFPLQPFSLKVTRNFLFISICQASSMMSKPKMYILSFWGWNENWGALASEMRYQEEPRKMWSFLHERYWTTTKFNKATLHSTLVQLNYIGQPMCECFAKLESYSAQLAFMDGPINEGFWWRCLQKRFSNVRSCPAVQYDHHYFLRRIWPSNCFHL